MIDPMVDELRKYRDQHARRFGFDLDAICEDLRRIERTCGHRVVSFPPKMMERRGAARGEKPHG